MDAVIHTLKLGMVSGPIKTEAAITWSCSPRWMTAIIQADLATQERLRQELLAEKRRKRFEEVIADIRANAAVRWPKPPAISPKTPVKPLNDPIRCALADMTSGVTVQPRPVRDC